MTTVILLSDFVNDLSPEHGWTAVLTRLMRAVCPGCRPRLVARTLGCWARCGPLGEPLHQTREVALALSTSPSPQLPLLGSWSWKHPDSPSFLTPPVPSSCQSRVPKHLASSWHLCSFPPSQLLTHHFCPQAPSVPVLCVPSYSPHRCVR